MAEICAIFLVQIGKLLKNTFVPNIPLVLNQFPKQINIEQKFITEQRKYPLPVNKGNFHILNYTKEL
jgi:hypothetical protein